MINLKKLCFLAVMSVSTASYSGDKILWQDDAHNGATPKSLIFNQVLSQDKNRGYSGALPIANVNGKNYVLLSQEGNNGKATGTYCDFGGKVDAKETRWEALLREFYEESSRVYDFRGQADDAKTKVRACHGGELLTAFFDVEYKKRQVFLDALAVEKKIPHNKCFHEKSDFIWVDINHLFKTLMSNKIGPDNAKINVQVLDDDGKISPKTIVLRNFFATTLSNSAPILKKYLTKDGPVADVKPIVDVKPIIDVKPVDVKPVAVLPAASPDIKAINSLKEITTAKFKEKTIILLDLDENVILEKAHSPKKYHHLIDDKIGYRLIEGDLAATIGKLKTSVGNDTSKVVILGLTKRGTTKHHKYDLGNVHLEKNGVPLSRDRFRKFNGKIKFQNPNAGFYNGVIHTAGQDKGVYLEAFLNQVGYKPAHIVMSDDKVENLQDVQKFAKKIGVTMDAYEMKGADLLK